VTAVLETPDERAADLLCQVMGEARFRQFQVQGYLDLPSRRKTGRTYRLDTQGNLLYREAGETSFNTTLCVQATETVPRDDLVAMRYLLVTADEDRLLEVANAFTFGLTPLLRALYHDFAERLPSWSAALLTLGLTVVFFGGIGVEAWSMAVFAQANPALCIVLCAIFLVPAIIGCVLVVAGFAELFRAARSSLLRVHASGD
jgi:hypothetical protein